MGRPAAHATACVHHVRQMHDAVGIGPRREQAASPADRSARSAVRRRPRTRSVAHGWSGPRTTLGPSPADDTEGRSLRKTIEERWVSVIDSGSWRRVMRSRPGSRLLASRPYGAADTARRFVSTSLRSARHPGRFRHVETICIFLGHVKSGGTLIGALLDAHPDAVVADEIDVLRYLRAGFRREQIFDLLLKGSKREARKGRVTARRLEPYSLAVPTQWQGRYDVLRVIGESRAGPTTRRFGHDPRLLPRLYERMGAVRPRFIHVVRNPYDPIAAMIVRGKRSFADASSDYARQCRTLLELRERIQPEDLLTVRYEDFVGNPEEGLERVCGFLGIEASDDYRAACARIVDPAFRPERLLIDWRPQQIGAVRALIEQIPFLDRYGVDGHGRDA
jgi:hypothetical protein